jgi:hypothetical protein
MADPTRQETEQVFKVLKAQKANKARISETPPCTLESDATLTRCALTARLGIRHGRALRLVYIYVLIVPAYTAGWESILVSSGAFSYLLQSLVDKDFAHSSLMSSQFNQPRYLAAQPAAYNEGWRERVCNRVLHKARGFFVVERLRYQKEVLEPRE